MRRDEMELCQMAIAKGWITPQEVQIAMRDQAETSDATLGARNIKPIGVVLVARGFLTDVQLRELQETLKSKGVKSIADRTLLGQILLDERLISREQLDEAMATQRESTVQGKRKRIGEILVELKFVEPPTVIKALRKQRKEILECQGCRARFNVVEFKSLEKYLCPKCNSQLVPGTMLLDVDDTTVGIKPAEASDLPLPVQEQAGPKVHFGKYVVMRELFRFADGPVHLAWQKDRNRFVALLFVAREPPTGYAGKIAATLTKEAQSHQITLSGFLESGTYEGRRYLSWNVPGMIS